MSKSTFVRILTSHDAKEISDLVGDVVSALEAGGLSDQLDVLEARVLARGPDAIFDGEPQPDHERALSFKPMVELLLREVLHLARLDALPTAARVEQIQWTLEMAGF
jgi:hypothetical protein